MHLITFFSYILISSQFKMQFIKGSLFPSKINEFVDYYRKGDT